MAEKYRHHGIAFPDAGQSTAYNLDYTLAVWRDCFEGNQTWLERGGSGYHAGDMWGCVGRWYAGNWRDGKASGYIGRVQSVLNARPWEIAEFKNLTSPASSG
jgi:autotransporter family porin